MIHRDKLILEQLEQFRVLTRDQLIELNFSDQKQPVVSCNRVMRRLVDRGHVRVNKNVLPHDYFLKECKVKEDSIKLKHFKAITDFTISAMKLGNLKEYEVEPKLGEKGIVEPDLFMIWNGAPFFVEVQRLRQSKAFIRKKIKDYGSYFYSGEWKDLHWQPKNKFVFPYIWIVSEKPYELPETTLKVFQTRDVEHFIQSCMKKGNQ